MKNLIIALLLISFGVISAQDKKYNAEELSITPLIDGTLIIPESASKPALVIIIAGSGPTTRDGNQQMMENNSLKYLAEGLFKEGIASFRYDKRIVKLMKQRRVEEKKINFKDFINDAIAVAEYFKKDSRFSNIYIVGHSQGSLIGMIAAQGRADGFVSIAGAGQEIDNVIVDQLAQQAPGLVDNARSSFEDLSVTGSARNYSPGLASIFRPDIQPFILSWMQYDPKVEIAKLKIPVLILNGDKDLQVQVSEAELLKAAKPDAQYAVIPNMNHIMKQIDGNDLENSKSYNEYKLPVMPELIEIISMFIKK